MCTDDANTGDKAIYYTIHGTREPSLSCMLWGSTDEPSIHCSEDSIVSLPTIIPRSSSSLTLPHFSLLPLSSLLLYIWSNQICCPSVYFAGLLWLFPEQDIYDECQTACLILLRWTFYWCWYSLSCSPYSPSSLSSSLLMYIQQLPRRWWVNIGSTWRVIMWTLLNIHHWATVWQNTYVLLISSSPSLFSSFLPFY